MSLKIKIFRSAMFYYVIVTSYVDRFSWILYQWKEETLTYNTMVPNNYTLGASILNSQGVVTTPLWRRVTKKAQEDEGKRTHLVWLYLKMKRWTRQILYDVLLI